ncbi:MAG: hypothetical protein Q9204_007298, partial [Flavoplaca sp. TL-2023a]
MIQQNYPLYNIQEIVQSDLFTYVVQPSQLIAMRILGGQKGILIGQRPALPGPLRQPHSRWTALPREGEDDHSSNLSCIQPSVFTFYTFYLTLLSTLNLVFLSLVTIGSDMGLWVFGDGSNGTAHWEPDPANARGTWSILSTCIITLALCLYTSLHLNVPAHRTTLANIFFMKTKYVIFGLLAPELTVLNAWRQRTVASALRAQLRRDRGGKVPTPIAKRLGKLPSTAYQGVEALVGRFMGKPAREKSDLGLPFVASDDPWARMTLVNAFYIIMGGYTFDVSKDTKPRIWPQNVDRLTPNVQTVLHCLTSHDKDLRGVIPFVSEEEIWDKSKANALAKTIVCIQATWFCAQCIARIAQQMPISLLELNTFAHAVCALLVYILWWSKPLDVQEPTVIDVGQSDTARNVCALAWSGPLAPVAHLRRVSPMDNPLDQLHPILQGSAHYHLGDGPLIASSQTPRPTQAMYAQNIALKRVLALEQPPANFVGLDSEQISPRIWTSSDPPSFALQGGESIPSTALQVAKEWNWIDVDEILLERLRVVEKLRNLPNFAAYSTAFASILDTTDPNLCMLKPRELNFEVFLVRQNYGFGSVGHNLTGKLGIIVAGFLYGGLHMIAWGSTAFTSQREDIAWKISCCVVAGGGAFFAVGGVFSPDDETTGEQAIQRMRA